MTESHSPKVSVIVPAYNKPEYLPECLRSVQAQTFTDWECIVVNDGSPRGDKIRAAVAVMNDPRFRLVEHEKNRGPGAARNTGASVAGAQHLLFVDEDDLIDSRLIRELQIALLHRGCDIVCPGGRHIGGKDNVIQPRVPTLDKVLTHQTLLGVGFLISKTAFNILGQWDETAELRGREDHDFWIRAIRQRLRIEVMNVPLYLYRFPRGNDEEQKSLNLTTMMKEVKLTQTLIQKHCDLYQRYPDAKNELLRFSYGREIRRRLEHGDLLAIARAAELAVITRDHNELRKVLSCIGEALRYHLRAHRVF